MQIREVSYPGGLPIEGYGPGFFRIAGTARPAPLAVLPSGVLDWAGWEDPAPLVARAAEVDVLFVGTGPEMARPPAAFRDAMEAAGVAVEYAPSPGACRTYNVLLGEGRRVGIALLPV
jgi:uncharacterized protein